MSEYAVWPGRRSAARHLPQLVGEVVAGRRRLLPHAAIPAAGRLAATPVRVTSQEVFSGGGDLLRVDGAVVADEDVEVKPITPEVRRIGEPGVTRKALRLRGAASRRVACSDGLARPRLL